MLINPTISNYIAPILNNDIIQNLVAITYHQILLPQLLNLSQINKPINGYYPPVFKAADPENNKQVIQYCINSASSRTASAWQETVDRTGNIAGGAIQSIITTIVTSLVAKKINLESDSKNQNLSIVMTSAYLSIITNFTDKITSIFVKLFEIKQYSQFNKEDYLKLVATLRKIVENTKLLNPRADNIYKAQESVLEALDTLVKNIEQPGYHYPEATIENAKNLLDTFSTVTNFPDRANNLSIKISGDIEELQKSILYSNNLDTKQKLLVESYSPSIQNEINQVISAIRSSNDEKQKMVFIQGSPSTGKTYLVNQIGELLGLPIATSNLGDFKDFMEGREESEIWQLYKKFNNNETRMIIFIDEVDFSKDIQYAKIASQIKESNNHKPSIKLGIMYDRVPTSLKPIIFFASNKSMLEQKLDPAFLSRLSLIRMPQWDNTSYKQRISESVKKHINNENIIISIDSQYEKLLIEEIFKHAITYNQDIVSLRDIQTIIINILNKINKANEDMFKLSCKNSKLLDEGQIIKFTHQASLFREEEAQEIVNNIEQEFKRIAQANINSSKTQLNKAQQRQIPTMDYKEITVRLGHAIKNLQELKANLIKDSSIIIEQVLPNTLISTQKQELVNALNDNSNRCIEKQIELLQTKLDEIKNYGEKIRQTGGVDEYVKSLEKELEDMKAEIETILSNFASSPLPSFSLI